MQISGKRKFINAFLALAIVFSYHLAYAQEAEEKDIQRGIWLYQHENYEEAAEVLTESRKNHPESSLAAYYLGLTYKQLQDYKAAKPHLEAAVELRPKIKGALIELIDLLYRLNELDEAMKWIKVAETEEIRPAQVEFLKGLVLIKEGKDMGSAVNSLEEAKDLDSSLGKIVDYHIGIAYLKNEKLKEAKQVFESIVKDYPSTDLSSFAEQYLAAIEKREEQARPLKIVTGYAVQYDDNVVLQPSDAQLAADIADKGDWRQYVHFRGEYDFKPTKRFGLRGGYSFHYSKQSDLGFYDNVGNAFTLQPSYYTEKAVISFPANFNHQVVNDKNYLASVTVANANSVMLAENQMAQGGFTWRYEDFLWIPSIEDEGRDGNEYMLGLGYYYFFAKNEGFINLRYLMDIDDTTGRNWKFFGNKITLNALIPVIERVRVNLSGEAFIQNFLKTHSIFNKKRNDAVFLLSALLSVEIVKGTDLQLQYTFVRDVSNISLYDYSRNVYSVGMQFKF